MALLRFSDGKNKEVNAATGLRIWQILHGQAEPESKAEEAVCMRVKKIYLNWHNAPDDYITERFEVIAPMALARWRVAGIPSGSHQHTSIGLATSPEPGDSFTIEFCKKWGLLDSVGRVTAKAKRYM